MKLPRNLDGKELIKALKRAGYEITRQRGSHVRLTRLRDVGLGEHHVTVPLHRPLRLGTLAALLDDVAVELGTDREGVLAYVK